MFEKYLLAQQVARTLQANEFDLAFCKGCFDIVAKREELLLLKILSNIDALLKEQALSLKAISYFTSGFPLVISLRNTRERLKENIIYSRFGLAVVTPKMFEEIIKGKALAYYSMKGKHVVEIDAKRLKERREELGYSLAELSKLTKISKKTLHKIERKRALPKLKTLKKIERVLSIRLSLPFKLKKPQKTILKAKGNFAKQVSKELLRIGIENSPLYSLPFNLIGRGEFLLTTKFIESWKEAQKFLYLKSLSNFLSAAMVFVAKRSREKTVAGVPILRTNDLERIESTRELGEVIKERAN